jgi:tRNA pseudouridine38-40 synthase
MRDFASFTADEPDEKSTKVLVDRLELAEDGELVLIRIVGSHFLWRMVRRIVGVLAAAARGQLDARDVASMLESESEVPGTLTAPASGLFLESVIYRGDSAPGPLRAVADVRGRR